MKKILPALLVGAALGGAGVWLATHHAAPEAAEAAGPAIEVKPSSAELAKLITEAGIAVGPVGSAQYSPETSGYGRVLDTGAFLSARADVAAAQATADGSQKEFVRLKALHDNGENASAQAVETAESAALRDRAQLTATQARLQAAWGPILSGGDADATLRQLGAGTAALVRIDLAAGEAAPATNRARVSTLTGPAAWKEVEILGPAVATDPQFQGRGWLAVWRDQPPAVGTALRATVPSVQYVSPEADVGWERISRDGKEINTVVRGCTSDYLPVARRWVDKGRFLSDLDQLVRADVCVIGSAVAEDLFGLNADPLGQTVKVRGRNFVVVGVLNNIESTGVSIRPGGGKSKGGGGGMWRWRNSGVYIPLETALLKFTGNDKLTGLGLRVPSAEALADAVPQITRTLLQSHNRLQDFRVDTNEETLDEFRKTEAAFTLSLGGVAGISLFVGGIGIMNVMLASINERIREIGVRKSVGARASDIFLQFLAEAAVIASVGGFIGLAVAAVLLAVMNFILSSVVPGGVAATLNPWVMFGGFASSVTIGLLAGVYPAVRAARLDPIEALRHE